MQQILLAGGGVPSIVTPRLGESPMRTSALGKGATRSPVTPGLQNSPKKVIYTIISNIRVNMFLFCCCTA